jgi:hypothetical protein
MDGTDAERDAQLRLKQAQAMLDLFEGDRRRAAVTLEELREWANAQDQEDLQFRVDHYLEFENEVRRTGCRVRPASPAIVPVFELAADRALVPRNGDAAPFALEAEIAIVIRQAGIAPDHGPDTANGHGRRSWWRRLVG